MLGIASSILQAFNSQYAQNAKNKFQQVKGEFQQLGQDLQSGNLTKAQQDYATLSKNIPSAQQSANGPMAHDLGALGQALQSGNLTSAQQAYSTIQQDLTQFASNGSLGSSSNSALAQTGSGSLNVTV